MKLKEWFLELFRKKEFYKIDNDRLKNEFSIVFKEITDDDLVRINKVITSFKIAEEIEDRKAKLYINDSVIYHNIDKLILGIKEIIKIDYRDTYFKSKKGGWDFQYYLNSSGGLYKDVLFLSNSMTYPNDENYGNVIYHILAIKKDSDKYYLWDLLDKEDK